MRALLADDERLIRTALATLLPLESELKIVAEAVDGAEAIRLFEQTRPDVVILDLDMPVVDGLDAAAQMLAQHENQAILVLTRHARPGTLRRALRLGVRGFLGKDTDPDEIAAAAVAVAQGERVIDPAISARALVTTSPLTEREEDVLRVTGEGYSVRDIARILHLSPGTVRNYLSSAIQKTGTQTRHDAARHARENDWL